MTSVRDRLAAMDPAALAADPTLAERAVLAGAPAYLARVDELAARSADRIRERRSAMIQGLRDDAATAAQAPRPRMPWFRTLAVLLTYLAAGTAFALFFSRADIDLEVAAPVAMGFAAASALCYVGASLPVRRSSPPPAAVAFCGWVAAALIVAPLGFASFLVLRFEPSLVPWLVVGAAALILIILLAAWCAWARRGLAPEPRPRRADQDGDAFTAELASSVAEERNASARAVRDLYAALPEDERAALAAGRSAAVSALAARGIDTPLGDPLGSGVVSSAVDRAARAVGVR